MRSLAIGLSVAAGLSLAICAVLHAQQPLTPIPTAPKPLVGPGSSNLIRNAGNGFGNTIVVENQGGGPASTVIENTRNGIGNKVMVINNGQSVVLTSPPTYQGKATNFYSTKVYCDSLGCTVFYSPKDLKWYVYMSGEDLYRPLPDVWQKLMMLDDF